MIRDIIKDETFLAQKQSPPPRKARRWRSIKARYQNEKFQVRLKTFTALAAQIIQHKIDHCEGVLI